MNLILLGLTVLTVFVVIATVFWLVMLLGPLHKKQEMRKQARSMQSLREKHSQEHREEQHEEQGEEQREKDAD